MNQHHIFQQRAVILEALGSDDRVLSTAALAQPWNHLLLTRAAAIVTPSRLDGERLAFAPGGERIERRDAEDAEQESRR